MKRLAGACLVMGLASSLAMAQSTKPLLLRRPAVSKTQIVFSFAGDLWAVGREGGEAKRLTSGIGIETDPMVERAVESLPKAKALLESANRVIVQRLAK